MLECDQRKWKNFLKMHFILVFKIVWNTILSYNLLSPKSVLRTSFGVPKCSYAGYIVSGRCPELCSLYYLTLAIFLHQVWKWNLLKENKGTKRVQTWLVMADNPLVSNNWPARMRYLGHDPSHDGVPRVNGCLEMWPCLYHC